MSDFLSSLSINDTQDFELSNVEITGLNIEGESQYDIEDDLIMDGEDLISIDSFDETIRMELDNADDDDTFNHIGDQRINEIEFSKKKTYRNGNIFKNEDSNKAPIMGGILNSINKTSQRIFSPTQLGAGLAKKSFINRFKNLENLNSNSKDSLNFIDLTNDDFNNIDDIYSETPLKNKNYKVNNKLSISKKVNFNEFTNKNKSSESINNLTSETNNSNDTESNDKESLNEFSDIESIGKSTPLIMTPISKSKPLSMNTPLNNINIMNNHFYYNDTNSSTPRLPDPWEKNSNTPYLISSYLQIIFKIITGLIIFYLIFSIITSIKIEILQKLNDKFINETNEKIQCQENFLQNKCHPLTVVPALREQCFEWERCMNRKINFQKNFAIIGAETLGIIINKLVEPISFKTFTFGLLGLSFWIFGSNFFFGFIRAKSFYKNEVDEKKLISYDKKND